jgi:hypothetical protein
MRYEQPDAANTEVTLIQRPTRASPPAEATARWRRGTLAADKRVIGPPPSAGGHSRPGREHPARKARGRRVHALELGG